MTTGKLTCLFWSAAALWCSIFFVPRITAFPFLAAGLTASAAAWVLLSLQAVRWRRLGLALLFLGLGGVLGSLRLPGAFSAPWRIPGGYSGMVLEGVQGFSGVLLADSSASPGKATRYELRLEQVWSRSGEYRGRARGRVLLWASGGPPLFMGQTIRVEGGLKAIHEPGPFQYGSRAGASSLQAGGFRSGLLRSRAAAFSAVRDRVRSLPPELSALLNALLLGEREDLDPGLYEKFRSGGSLHLLALSGLHLGIIFAFISFTLSVLPDRRVRAVLAATLVLVYLFLVGFRPSLERAALMLLAGSAGFALDREPNPLNILALSAFLLLLLRPFHAFDLSFQLSFLSLLGLLLLGPFFSRLLRPRLPAWMAWPLSLSLGAQVGSAPLLLSRFAAVHPVGALSALILIPLVTLFILLGLAYLVLSVLFWPLASLAAWLLSALYGALDLTLSLSARAPALHLQWRPWYWIVFLLCLLPFLLEPRPAC